MAIRSQFTVPNTPTPAPNMQGKTVIEPDSQLFVGSPEQEAVWAELLQGERNMIVRARAGTGKTTTMVQYCLRETRSLSLGFVAFNRHIADELKARLAGKAMAMTYHQLGLKAIARGCGGRSPKIDKWKTYTILDAMTIPCEDGKEKLAKSRISKLVSLSKQYGVWGRAEMEWIVEHHDLDFDGMEELVYEYTPRVMLKAKQRTGVVDFDDMIWLPKELGFKPIPFDVLLIDEAQDTNIVQQWLALNSSDRLVVIGDDCQAIYSFRGADSESMNRIKAALEASGRGCVELPLTVTRRCSQEHVRMAQMLVPDIQAMPDAIEGKTDNMAMPDALAAMKPGDMVLCRVNAELLMCAYKLLRLGVKAVVRGRDIGEGIIRLIEEAEEMGNLQTGMGIAELIATAGEITGELVAKFEAMPNDKGVMRAASCKDRYECLMRIADSVQVREGKKANSKSVIGAINALFADFDVDGKPQEAVVLSTVHRAKGLEADRVWILRGDLMPHPAARQKHEREQECNLAYVAVTRAKKELIWVDHESVLFMRADDQGEDVRDGDPKYRKG